MSKTLEDFLIERNYCEQELEYEFEQGNNTFKIKYRPLSTAEYGELRLKCRTVDPSGLPVMDESRFNCEIIAKCCKSPNFNDMALVERGGCKTPVQFVSTKFSPLEVQDFANVILTCSGVSSKKIEETVEEIKKL